MSHLSLQQLRQLFDSAASQYERLFENRTKLEADCNKLREYIDAQVQHITELNNDFTKLRNDFMTRCGGVARPAAPPPPAVPEQAQQAQQAQGEASEPEITVLAPVEKPLNIALVAEICDVSVICATAFSPDGKTLRVYDIDKDEFMFQYGFDEGDDQSENHIRSIVWMDDCKTFMCGGKDGKVRIFSMSDSTMMKIIDAGSEEIFQLAIAHNQEFFVAVSADGALSLFSLHDYSLVDRWKRELDGQRVAMSVAISPDDKIVAIGYSDCFLSLWDVETRRPVLSKVCHDNGIYTAKFIPKKTQDENQKLVTGSLDNSIKIWDVVQRDNHEFSLELVRILDGHSSFVLSLAVDPTGEWLISGSKDLTARISSISRGLMLYSVKAHTNSVMTVSFNPKRSMFCTGSGDQCVRRDIIIK